MFCGSIFTSTDLQNHKKNQMKKSQKRFYRVNRALFLSLSNAFEEQKFIPKFSQKNLHPVFPRLSVGDSVPYSIIAGSVIDILKWFKNMTHGQAGAQIDKLPS